MRSLRENLKQVQSLAPAARTASANGAAADAQNAEMVSALLDVGLWTDGGHLFTVEWDDDDGSGSPAGSWANVPAASIKGAVGVTGAGELVDVDDAAADNQLYRFDIMRTDASKRHFRIVQTVSGGPATGLVSGAVIELGGLRYAGGSSFVEPNPA